MPATIAAIASKLGDAARRFDIDLLESCDSTNAVLLGRAEAGAPAGTVVIASEQTAGRGRRGRDWFASPGDSLTFSLLWRFAPGTAPGGLSLAVGVAVMRALANVASSCAAKVSADATAQTPPPGDIALKWPNDILLDGRKLGGILVELLSREPHSAVIGIGINLRLPASMPADVRAVSAALCELGESVDEDNLYASLLGELLPALELFAAQGFAALREEWLARHAFEGAAVKLASDFAAPRIGICRGVDADGALLLDVDGRIERVLSGEVSLRPA